MTNGQANTTCSGMREPSRAPIAVSAFVCPGIGQMMQKRWIAGSIYLVVFLAIVVLALVYVLKVMSAWYGLITFDGADTDIRGSIMPSAVKAVALLLAALAVQIACVIDSWIAYLHLRREWARATALGGAVAGQSPGLPVARRPVGD